ncbi:oxygenase [Lithospermum erythrorhizon]|uniref:Lipoxygenase n=1 Tax=Lithospermum erythrorhizon TaxID=34254 RepID=A0AAV3R3A0_LITER
MKSRKGNQIRQLSMNTQRICSKIVDCLNAFQGKVTSLQVYSGKHPEPLMIKGEFVVRHGQPSRGKAVSIQLHSLSEVDPSSGKGKLSQPAYLKKGMRNKDNNMITYKVKFEVTEDFGTPGAFIITNRQKDKFFLQSATLQVQHNPTVHFECNSWIYPTQLTNQERVFFSNTCYLPGQTPASLILLRKEELAHLRGDGTGTTKEWERVYDYDYYNDLGNPDEGPENARPKLGGSDFYPYPRRERTGRPSSHDDTETESRPGLLDMYVPPDERMSPEKLAELMSNIIQAVIHFVKPHKYLASEEDFTHVESFDEIFEMYSTHEVPEDWLTEKVKPLVPDELFKKIKQTIKEMPEDFPLPRILAENELAWKDDEEFTRQMLAGVNPTVIKCLHTFPPQSKTGVRSSIKRSDIEHNLDGLTVEEAMEQWRIFILDHHDYLIPFLNGINTKGICAYASRTLLFLRDDHTLKPLAIELSLPSASGNREIRRVVRPAKGGTEGALWQLAKTHVAVNDSGFHQLINNWLKTHAVIEPFIIATRRHLSMMHPVHRLLVPHFKDTMHLNAFARNMILNSGGVLERVLYSGKMSMQLSSALYKEWRFDEQSLPADLLKRGMAISNPDEAAGVQLVMEDYPYGVDGLDIWVVLQRWVSDFCSYIYKDNDALRSDHEIQEWWYEIRHVGHGDKYSETWWYSMTTVDDLKKTLTTLIWIVSVLHASQNFGQYAYCGYPPNRPTACRRFIPKEGTKEFADFLTDPDMYFLKMLPTKFEMTLSITLVEVLSRHISEEVYLGQQSSPNWIDDEWINRRYKEFAFELQLVERRILKRNKDPSFRNRRGPAKIPYKLLYPDTLNVRNRSGITDKGIPNSISI